MISILTVLFLSLAVYACVKWWFDTSLLDHLTSTFTVYRNFQDLKLRIGGFSKIGELVVELFECPWCLAFHFSMWLNLANLLTLGYFNFMNLFVFTLISAGGGMFLYQQDLKD